MHHCVSISRFSLALWKHFQPKQDSSKWPPYLMSSKSTLTQLEQWGTHLTQFPISCTTIMRHVSCEPPEGSRCRMEFQLLTLVDLLSTVLFLNSSLLYVLLSPLSLMLTGINFPGKVSTSKSFYQGMFGGTKTKMISKMLSGNFILIF